MNKTFLMRAILFLIASNLFLLSASSQAAEKATGNDFDEGTLEQKTAAVELDGRVLFVVRGISSFPAEKRAERIADRIAALAADPSFDAESLELVTEANVTHLMGGNKKVAIISESDAQLEGVDRHTLSNGILIVVKEAIESWRLDRAPQTLRNNGLFTLGATLILLLLLWGGGALYRHARKFLEALLHERIRDLQLKEFRIVRAQQIYVFLRGTLTFVWVSTVLVLLYAHLSAVLSLFPWTRGLGNNLVMLVVDPLKTIGFGILGAIPNLVFLLVLFFVARYLLKIIQLFFTNIAEANVVLADFDAEWAMPTYRLVRILLIAFSIIVAYPYIPGSGSEAFKGVSLFLGVIFSLGSSSLVGNLIAGYTMTYRRAFKIGDRVKIGEHIGDVEQVRMLVTNLRTLKNEEVVIPNSVILNSDVINFSTIARKQGLILHTTVGIGYETPWRQVEAMLLEAADRSMGFLKEPRPFVLQKGLGDFCVTYEINAYCTDPQAMASLYTELHRNTLDVFNEYGVQIMTPAYERDPEQPKLVPKEQWYAAPAIMPQK
jgi:small-conductance mechanosensitive channel